MKSFAVIGVVAGVLGVMASLNARPRNEQAAVWAGVSAMWAVLLAKQ